ncbi:fetal and adult testis-expressed transcript protein isoform X2 [Heterocephalus glaber]|uniref:Fetal and adult testis-expressed transcript protein isoform X2 n=2 Tax=Heterocephalus glaber TaxID=10181 RepID=A0AAX6S9U5_HETGA|nr:fetal and adult testis-expressed transcript protein isoform X2 [Heterocephalus glaber]
MTGYIFLALLPWKRLCECLLCLVHPQLSRPTEQLAVMAASPSSIEEDNEMCINKEPAPGSHRQGQDHLMIVDILDHGPWSTGVSQRDQKAGPKVAVSIITQSPWNMTSSGARKAAHQWQGPRVSGEPGHGDAHSQECPGSFQGCNDPNLGLDLLAELGLDELNGLEMEIMRRQLLVITERLCALEDRDATWRFKEAVIFTMMVLACVANVWLWMRQ